METTTGRGRVRDLILRTALHLFANHGYFNTSVHDIQASAGVSIGSIYNHFGGKEGVARALYADLVERMDSFVERVIDGEGDTRSKGRALVAGLFSMAENDPEVVGYVLNSRHREFLPDELPICSAEPFVRMRDLIRDGIEKGEVRDMDPIVAASCAYGPALRMIGLRLDGLVRDALPKYTDPVWNAAWKSIAA
ncbi:MAG: TetR/AcrR family transcriptional regulator [Proteobacteria bacterium]|nr:MAG: TetR/AcrR family transcriptional regulator [Pseudomonadota bacterium]